MTADDIITHSSDNEGLLSRASLPLDEEPEILSLRPSRLAEYIGQRDVVMTLEIAIQTNS